MVEHVECRCVWPVAEEVANSFLKIPKLNDKLYERNCEIMTTVTNAAWAIALVQDLDILKTLQKNT